MSDTLSNRLRKSARLDNLDVAEMIELMEEAADAIEVLDKLSIASTEVERELCAKIAETFEKTHSYETMEGDLIETECDVPGLIAEKIREDNMKPTTIYLVEGNTGFEEKYREWTVCAFKSELKANELRDNAIRRGKELEEMGRFMTPSERQALENENEFDPKMQIKQGVIDYIVYSTELR